MSTQEHQRVSKPATSSSMRDQGGVNEIPRDHQDGSEDDVPSQQGFVVIDHQEGSDDEGLSSEEEELQNGGYQLLAQDPDGPEDNEDESEPATTTGSSSTSSSSGAPSYDPVMMQQVASLSQSSSASSTHPHLPQHMASLMPTQIPQPDQAARVSYSDTTDVREQRKQKMAGDDQIKAAMAGFKLPGLAMPQWANFVSEQDWKKNLGSKLSDSSKRRQSGKDKDETGESKDSPECSADR